MRIITPAIILKRIPYGEADQVVTFFGRREGRLAGLAKAAKRSRRRFGAGLEPGSLVEVVYVQRPGAELVRLEEAHVKVPATGLVRSLERISATAEALELALAFLRERQRAEEKFDLLAGHLKRIAAAEPKSRELAQFECDWLRLAGFQPVFDRCTRCDTPADADRGWMFDPHGAGLVCSGCAGGRGQLIPLPLCARGMMDTLSGASECDEEGWDGIRSLLARYVQHIIGRPLMSQRLAQSWGVG